MELLCSLWLPLRSNGRQKGWGGLCQPGLWFWGCQGSCTQLCAWALPWVRTEPPGEPQCSANTMEEFALEAVQETKPWGEELLWKTKDQYTLTYEVLLSQHKSKLKSY